MLLVYYSFIMVIAFYPDWLGIAIVQGGVLTWGLAVGIGIIFFTFVITGFYIHKANNLYDGLMQKIINASQEHVDGMPGAESGDSE